MNYKIDLNLVDKTKTSPTKPNFENNQNTSASVGSTPFSFGGDKNSGGSKNFIQIARLASNFVSGNQLNITAMANALGAGTVVYAILEIAKKAYEITMTTLNYMEPFITTSSGDYNFATELKNFQNTVNAIMSPVGTVINYYQEQNRRRVFNLGQEQNRMLLGDSIINEETRSV